MTDDLPASKAETAALCIGNALGTCVGFVEPQLLAHPQDVETPVRAIPLIRAIAAQPALARYIEAEVQPGPAVNDPESLTDFVRRLMEGISVWIGAYETRS